MPSAGTFAFWLVALTFLAVLIGVPTLAVRLILGPPRRPRPR